MDHVRGRRDGPGGTMKLARIQRGKTLEGMHLLFQGYGFSYRRTSGQRGAGRGAP
jgi:hypothetical protein